MDQARVLLGCLARVAHLPFIKPHYILGLTGLSYTRQPPFRWNSSSSKQWLTRQRSDPFVKAAQSQHYRARSAFKLIQMNEKYRFLRRGAIVVDCGAAPGGWAQVAAEKVVSKSHSTVVDALSIDARKPDTDDLSNDTLCEPTTKIENPNAKTQDGSVIAIDLLPIEPIPGVTVIQGNFLEPRVQAQVRHALGRRRVDVVCSDMAPSFSGNHCSDHAKSMELCESALIFAEQVLEPGGTFVCKFIMGGTEHELRHSLQARFRRVRYEKPEASRKSSTEGFFVCLGFGEERN